MCGLYQKAPSGPPYFWQGITIISAPQCFGDFLCTSFDAGQVSTIVEIEALSNNCFYRSTYHNFWCNYLANDVENINTYLSGIVKREVDDWSVRNRVGGKQNIAIKSNVVGA